VFQYEDLQNESLILLNTNSGLLWCWYI